MAPSPPTTPPTLLSTLTSSLAPTHLLLYSTLLGSTLYQTFISGVVSFRALPRAHFSQLQQRVFPIYFTLQTVVPPLLYLTIPSPTSPTSPTTTTIVTLSTALVTSALNLAVVGPLTTRVMRERKARETLEGKKYHDPGPKSAEMARLNKRFAVVHGVSAVLNLLGLLATVGYGVVLGGRIQ